jgi:hypothetical protein
MRGRLLIVPLLVLFVTSCRGVADPVTPGSTGAALPSADASEAATRRPAPSATLSPTPTPRPLPTPVPDAPETLELEVTGCPGGVVVDWSPATHPEFHHYTALRSIEPEVEPAYPPIAPAVDWGDSYGTDRFVTSAVDATLIPSDTTLYYRVMAYDSVNRVVAATRVRDTHLSEVVELGHLVVEEGEAASSTHLDWSLFGGLARCFSAYHVLVGPAGTTPTSTLTVLSDQSTTELETLGLHPGESYAIQVTVMRSTTLGSFLVARSEVATYTVP